MANRRANVTNAKSTSPHQPTPMPDATNKFRLVWVAIALAVSILACYIPFAPSPSPTSPSASDSSSFPLAASIHARLARFDVSLDRYSHAFDTGEHQRDVDILARELAAMRVELDAIRELWSIDQFRSLTDATIDAIQAMPIRVLRALVRHRSGLIKLMIAGELHGLPYLTRSMVDAYDRQRGGFTLKPIRMLLETPNLFRWATITRGHTRTAIEVAVDRAMIEVVQLLLPIAAQECVPAAHANSIARLSALQLATNNVDDTMRRILLDDDNPCLIHTPGDSSVGRGAAAHGAPELKVTPSQPATPEMTPNARQHKGTGGWRKPASSALSKTLRTVNATECAITRIRMDELTADLFRSHVENKRPLLVHDALDSTRFSLGRQLRRSYLSRHWPHYNMSAGVIPYGEHFATRTGLVTFEEFFTYMDRSHEQRIEDNKHTRTVATNAAPYYIFDYKLLDRLGWHDSGSDTDADSSDPTRASDSHRLGSSSYQLPPAVIAVLNMSAIATVRQFFLGGEGTGAPFHFHCPAINLVVYGQKRSQHISARTN